MIQHDPYLYVRTLEPDDVDDVAMLLGRGMADNPMNVAVHRGDEDRRSRHHERLMRALLRSSPALHLEGVHLGDGLVGVAAAALPGHCQPSFAARTRLLTVASSFGPATLARLLIWTGGWARHDLAEPHVHLGPVSVEPDMRGNGIGRLLLLRHTAWLDSIGAAGYLETDRPEAVGFYGRFGYIVGGEEEILGVPCWFMRRPAKG